MREQESADHLDLSVRELADVLDDLARNSATARRASARLIARLASLAGVPVRSPRLHRRLPPRSWQCELVVADVMVFAGVRSRTNRDTNKNGEQSPMFPWRRSDSSANGTAASSPTQFRELPPLTRLAAAVIFLLSSPSHTEDAAPSPEPCLSILTFGGLLGYLAGVPGSLASPRGSAQVARGGRARRARWSTAAGCSVSRRQHTPPTPCS